jgi:hypothetical protein
LWSVGSFAASKKVLVIGIDGAGGRYVQEALAPNLDALAATGAGRYDYYNEGGMIPSAPDSYGASGVNWSTILTGVAAAKHGVSDNSFAGSNFTAYPHFFQHARLADPSLVTVSLSNWTPINTFITPNAYANIEIGYDSGTLAAQDTAVKNDAVSILSTQNPDAMFLHFDQVDGAGHSFGWGSGQHLAAIAAVDGLVGQVMSMLRARPGVVSGAEDWLVIVTADHGAARGATGHVASQGVENWETPFLLNGPSIAPGTPLARGSLRDVATTALFHLGVDPYLAGAGLDGVIRGLPILPPSGVAGDLNGDGVLSGDGLGPGSTDDVTRFVEHWLARGSGGVASRYGRGDLNADGVTDLADWAILHRLSPATATAVASRLSAVPEPSGAAAVLGGLLAALPVRPRRDSLNVD